MERFSWDMAADHRIPEVRQAAYGDYQVIREIGRGGAGAVYEVRDPNQRRLALKVLHSDRANPTAMARFQREAQAAAAVDHGGGIARIHEFGNQNGTPYLVMEFVEGRSLADAFGTMTRPTVREVAELVRDVARTLQRVHAAGIVHRDVKPGNILLPVDGGPLLTDFGLALPEADLTLTASRALLGTPLYMSPEQLRNAHDVDARTDVYALGAVLYEGLVGSPPGASAINLQELIAQVHSDTPPPSPRSVVASIPGELSNVCMHALAGDRDERYASAGDLADDLQRWLDGETPLAHALESGRLRQVRVVLRRQDRRLLGLGLGAALSLSLALFLVLRPAAPSSAPLEERAQALVAEATAQLASGETPPAALRERVAALRGELAPRLSDPESALGFRYETLLAAEAELALRSNDLKRAKTLLVELKGLPRAPSHLRDQQRFQRTVVEVQLALLEGKKDQAAPAYFELARVKSALQERPDLTPVLVRLALLAGRTDDAVSSLPADAPPSLRAEVLLATERWDELDDPLIASLEDPELKALVLYRVGVQRLASQGRSGRDCLEQAIRLKPNHPLRASQAEVCALEAIRWVAKLRERTTQDLPAQEQVDLLLLAVHHWVAARQLGRPPTQAEVSDLQLHIVRLAEPHDGSTQDWEDIVAVAPDNLSFLAAFADVVIRSSHDPQPFLPTLRRAAKVAFGSGDPQLSATILVTVAKVLRRGRVEHELLDLEPELEALAARVDREHPSEAELRADVRFELGKCLASVGREGEALELFEHSLRFAPTHTNSAQGVFEIRAKESSRKGQPLAAEVLASGWRLTTIYEHNRGRVYLRATLELLAWVEAEHGAPEKSLEAIDLLLSIWPESVWYSAFRLKVLLRLDSKRRTLRSALDKVRSSLAAGRPYFTERMSNRLSRSFANSEPTLRKQLKAGDREGFARSVDRLLKALGGPGW